MHNRFEAIYSQISEDYLDSSENRERRASRDSFVAVADNMASEVKERIERAIQETEANVRSDARHFLLINFSEMIFEPLLADQEGTLPREEILNDIEEDTVTILRDAVMRNDAEEQLGGAEILISLSKLYARLKVSYYRLWN